MNLVALTVEARDAAETCTNEIVGALRFRQGDGISQRLRVVYTGVRAGECVKKGAEGRDALGPAVGWQLSSMATPPFD